MCGLGWQPSVKIEFWKSEIAFCGGRWMCYVRLFHHPCHSCLFPRPVIYNKNMSDEERLARRQVPMGVVRWWLQLSNDVKNMVFFGIYYEILGCFEVFYRYQNWKKNTFFLNSPRVFQNSKNFINLPEYLWNFGKLEFYFVLEFYGNRSKRTLISSKNRRCSTW